MENQFEINSEKNGENLNKWRSESADTTKKAAGSIKDSAKDTFSKETNVMSKAFENLKHKGQDIEHDVEEKISSFFSDGPGHDALVYSKKMVKWIRANPAATTGIAVLGGVAVGMLIKRALHVSSDRTIK